MSSLSVSVLGPLIVTRGAQPVEDFGYNKVRGLLAYLAVEAGRPHKRAHLCTLLWPDQPESASRRNLSQALTQLRRALGGTGALDAGSTLLLANASAVQLKSDAGVEVDARHFSALLEACERHGHQNWHTCTPCAERQQAALALYRGDFLSELSLPDSGPFEEWALLWRERLRQRALSALERLANWAEWRGAFAAAAVYAQRQTEIDPLNEAAHRAAMRLLALNGELAAAGVGYDRLRRLLASELGLAPEAESVSIHERIRAGAVDSLRHLQAPPFNGPEAPNTLLGREEALSAVIEQLRTEGIRALTLTGTPGIGKTRLAFEAASRLRFDFTDGVHVVELGSVAKAAGVPAVVAQALGVKEQAARPLVASLAAHLKPKHALLVLDNFEHVLEAGGLVAELLAACPALQVLATSRAPLRIRAEHAWQVPALDEADAQQLFLERAGLAGAVHSITPQPAETIAAICRRLDRLPLAIELIAVRARTLSPVELLRQLDQPLGALTAAPRDLPQRHRTLSAAIAWSYDRLPAGEQTVFRHLGVFAKGATAEAAQAVAGQDTAVLPRLEALHETGLAQAEAGADETRFTLLETLREYARERLRAHGEAEAAHRRHAEYFLALVARAEIEAVGPDPTGWFDRLEREHANLRAALAWCQAQAPESGLRLAVALERFWEVRGHLAEGRHWLAEALQGCPDAALPLRGAALAAAGMLAFRQGDYAAARGLDEQSLSVWQRLEDRQAICRTLERLGGVAYSLGDQAQAKVYAEQSLAVAREIDDAQTIASALNSLGLIAMDEGDYALALARYRECLPLFRALDDHSGAGMTLNNLGLVAWHELDYQAAQARLEESLATFKEIGHKWGMALALLNLGNVARSQADLDRAEAVHRQSLALYRELGDQASTSYPLFGLGELAYAQGDLEAARSLYRESLALRCEAGEIRPVPRNLEGLGQLAHTEGRPDLAARLFGAAEALRESQGLRINPPYQAEYQREMAALRAALGEAEFEAAWAAGRALDLEQAAALANYGEGGSQGA